MALRIVLVLAVLSCFASAQRMVFEDPSSSDGVVVESSDPSVVDPNVDTRLFHGGSLLGGLLGGIKQKEICSANCGPGNPALSYQCCSYGYSQCCYGNAGGFGGYGIVKPGRCPGLLGLGSNVLPGGVPYGGVGYGTAGYGGYPAGYQGAYPGGYPNGYLGGAYPAGQIQTGFNPGYGGFHRSTDGNGGEAPVSEANSVKDSSAVKFRARRQTDDGADVDATAREGGEVDARFLGLFGQKCSFDIHCPGQLKCCFSGLKSTCQLPSIFS